MREQKWELLKRHWTFTQFERNYINYVIYVISILLHFSVCIHLKPHTHKKQKYIIYFRVCIKILKCCVLKYCHNPSFHCDAQKSRHHLVKLLQGNTNSAIIHKILYQTLNLTVCPAAQWAAAGESIMPVCILITICGIMLLTLHVMFSGI